MPRSANNLIVIPESFWERPQVGEALRTRDMGHFLALVRQYTGASQTQIGIAIGWPQGKVSDAMRGVSEVKHFAVFEQIADGLKFPDPARIILGLAPCEPLPSIPKPDRRGVSFAGRPDDEKSSTHEAYTRHDRQSSDLAILDEGDVERRDFLKLAGGMAITAPFSMDIDRPRRELDRTLDAESSRYDAEEWERVALTYSITVGRVSPIQVLPGLLADLDEAKCRLGNSRGDVRNRMTRTCALLSALSAIAFVNVGDFENANRHWRTAMRAADVAGDRKIQSLIRGRRAVFSLYDRSTPPSSILALASDAIDIAGGIACAGTASGHAARAQVFALLGRHEESINSLGQLKDIFARLPEPTASDRPSQWGWSEQRLRHVETYAYSYAGRLNEATESLNAALELYPKDGYQGRTQVELYRSICIIRDGDPAEGARHAVSTIQALPATYQKDAVVRRTAVLMLNSVPDDAGSLSAVSEAREMLMVTGGPS